MCATLSHMSNSGVVNVDTKHAGAGSVSVPGLGTFAPGMGLTVAPDGTVLLGTLEGKVIALHADGSPYWNRQLPGGEVITSPPVVGSDGSVYVVGRVQARDHRSLPDGAIVQGGRATLHTFTGAGGAPASSTTAFPQFDFGPVAIGAPNVWRFGSDEAIIVPALYMTPFSSANWHLLAFSPTGGLMADWSEHLGVGDVSSNTDTFDFLFAPFGPGPSSVSPLPPVLPGVAIATNPLGGTPTIVLIDRYNRQIIGFSFCVGASCSPKPGFTERFRTDHPSRFLYSDPIVLPDLHSIVGTDDGVVFSGPNGVTRAPLPGLGPIYATPTVRDDGRVIVVNSTGQVIAFAQGAIFARTALGGNSVARPAASRTHVFVATSDGFHTLDAAGANKLFTFPWGGGGLWSPAVGPGGYVYAMAANILFAFPPPPFRPHIEPAPPLVIR